MRSIQCLFTDAAYEGPVAVGTPEHDAVWLLAAVDITLEYSAIVIPSLVPKLRKSASCATPRNVTSGTSVVRNNLKIDLLISLPEDPCPQPKMPDIEDPSLKISIGFRVW